MNHCPVCAQPVPPREGNPHFPVCSDRCRAVDLGRWLGEGYVIPGPPVMGPLDDDSFGGGEGS